MSLFISLRDMYALYEQTVPGGTTPIILARCVGDLASSTRFTPKSGDKVSSAFAICISSLRKAGVLTKRGKMELTAKGKKRNAMYAKQPDTDEKVKKYEKVLAQAKSERAKK